MNSGAHIQVRPSRANPDNGMATVPAREGSKQASAICVSVTGWACASNPVFFGVTIDLNTAMFSKYRGHRPTVGLKAEGPALAGASRLQTTAPLR